MCRKHDFQPLFHTPPKDAGKGIIIQWFGMCLHYCDRHLICVHCGILGSERRGYSKGGRHAVKSYYSQANAAELKEQAANWNAKVQEEGNPIERTGNH